MLLYHYSKEPRKFLMPSRYTKKRTPEQIAFIEKWSRDIGRDFGYLDHISFFFEPIPADLGTLYKRSGINHPNWYPKSMLYQHVIDTQDLMFAYEIVESPEQMAFIEKHWRKELSNTKNYDARIEYFKKEAAMKRTIDQLASLGNNSELLEKAAAPFVGNIRDAYQHTLATEDEQFLQNMYAPGVPHVLFYTPSKQLRLVEPAKLIVLK